MITVYLNFSELASWLMIERLKKVSVEKKITFAWSESAGVKNASVTGNAVSMIGRYPLASGKI